MKRFINKLVYTAFISFGLMTTGCTDELFEENEASGYLRFEFAISNVITRGSAEINGESKYHENSIHNLDLYFYDTDAGDDVASKLHIRQSNINGNYTDISVGKLDNILNGQKRTFKVVAVANCSATNDADNKSLNQLKALAIKTPLFRGSGKVDDGQEIEDFVMTNFANISNSVEIDPNEGGTCTLTLRRVAAKIRVAIDVKNEITDANGVRWEPDLEDMRLFILNGVQTARLDGDITKTILENDDYYSIETTGSKYDPDRQGQLTESYKMSREISEHSGAGSDGKITDDSYRYYNDIPLYTYPNRWEDAMLENTQTTLIVVVPWEVKGSTDEVEVTYKPSYYSMPVTTTVEEDGYVNIVSNAYYYLRAYIGMMGSDTPLNPLEVEMECEIADWGVASETTADIRPLRFLQFNQTAFNVYNEPVISIPFYSSHNCSIASFYVEYYTYAANSGTEKANYETFYPTAEKPNYLDVNKSPYKFTCEINNNNKTLSIDQDFFKANKRSRFYVRIVVRHSDESDGTQYEETLFVTFYPGIYITTEPIESTSGALRNHDGYILVNGYGYAENDTGRLKEVDGREGDANDSRALTTFTITQITEEEKNQYKWVLGDPRQRNINLLLSTTSMATDTEVLERWTNSTYGGFYDGTANSGATGNSTNRHRYGSGLKTMWEYYHDFYPKDSEGNETGPEWTINGTWNVREDYWSDVINTPQYHRTLSYYYPAYESMENQYTIAPKFTIVSYHAYANAGLSGNGKEVARRRCAAYQQYGYPAGRWRLPTYAEIQYIKKLQAEGLILDVFGGSDNWSAQGRVNANGVLSTTDNNAYTRCVYDNWYWEQVEDDGVSYNRIPDPDGSHANWKKFHWGDRPRESVLTRTGEPITVESFLEKHKGIKAVEK